MLITAHTRHLLAFTALFWLSACGGGSGSGNPAGESSSDTNSSLSSLSSLASSHSSSTSQSSAASTSSAAALASLNATLSGLPQGAQVSLQINNHNPQVFSANGPLNLTQTWNSADDYHVQVASQPEGAYCVVLRGIGKPASTSVEDIHIDCASGSAAASAQLFDTDRLHRMRLTVSIDEWHAFTLTSYRSQLQSELYRTGTLEYLDSDNNLLATVPHVGFRMRGNTSRTAPESWSDGNPSAPRRFHINLKFDETFEDDESVYACIDNSGNPAAVNNSQCLNRVISDIPAVLDNDGRTFMGVESVALKMNKDDPTYIREVLAHSILRDNHAAAGRTTHVALELVLTASDTSSQAYGHNLPHTYQMGVFSLDEAVDKIFVRNRYGKNGYLFKISGSNLMQGDSAECLDYNPSLHGYSNSNYCRIGVEVIDPSSRAAWVGASNAGNANYVNNMESELNASGNSAQFVPYRPTFDLKTKKDEIATARAQLNALIALLNSNPSLEQLAEVFDIDSFIRAQAADIVIGAVDHYVRIANNYYLYLNPNTQKWHYLTYDYDFAFSNNHPLQWSASAIPVFDNVIASSIFQNSNGNRWADKHLGQNPELYHLIFADAQHRATLLQQVGELRRRWLDWQHRGEPLVKRWLDKLEPAISQLNVEDSFPDTRFNRQAATGSSYLMDYNGSPNSNDTLKNYFQGRHASLAGEAP